MHFGLDDDQTMIQDAVRRFAEAQVAPAAYGVDQAEAADEAALRGLAELGIMGMFLDPDHGGSGLAPLSGVVAIEEIARHDGALATLVAAHNTQAALHLDRFGPDALRAEHLSRLAAGGASLAWAVTEAETADPAHMQARAAPTDDGFRISGAKPWVRLGARAAGFVTVAQTDGGPAAFLVPADAPGVTRSPVRGRLGLRGADVAHVRFEGVEVPGGARLGGAGEAAAQLAAVRPLSLVAYAAVSVGIGRGALETARAYALERKQFRRPISDFQAIQWKLADCATELDAARLMVWRAADLLRQGQPAALAAEQARLLAADAAVNAANEAVQIHGGNGFVREYAVERYLRDAKTLQSGEGRADDLRASIGAALLA